MFILLAMCSTNLLGQFKLSTEGVLLNETTGKDFVVNTYEGISKDGLYKFAENKVIEIFVSPKNVISKSEDMISILGSTSFESKEYRFNVVFDFKFKILLAFKDDKIRYQITPISLYKHGNGSKSWDFDDFYKNESELRKPRVQAYSDLNNEVNRLISQFFYKDEAALDW